MDLAVILQCAGALKYAHLLREKAGEYGRL